MARQTGLLKISGMIDGLVFYERDGKFFVKGAGGADKNKILAHHPLVWIPLPVWPADADLHAGFHLVDGLGYIARIAYHKFKSVRLCR